MSRFLMRTLSLSVFTLSLAISGCGPSDEAELAPEPADEVSAGQPDSELGAGEVQASAFDGPCAQYCDDQCTTYARCRAPNLPTGLFTWSDKVAIINSNHAHAGCVAMILASNPAGHTAFVDHVDTAPSPNRITLHESNWSPGACTARTGTKAGLNIRNFWCPRSVHTANCAGPL